MQRAFYRETAHTYDQFRLAQDVEHEMALAFMTSMIGFFNLRSVLDIGSGTGRALQHLKAMTPNVRVIGVEPSPEMREQGHRKGLSRDALVDGDAMNLSYKDGEFELVCEFGALHHIPEPAQAVSEMLRVASKAIFISDSNNFGQGGRLSRVAKQTLNAMKLWPAARYVRSGGRGYRITDDDGLAYSYSLFADYRRIRNACSQIHMLNTRGSGPNLFRSASHVALFAVK